jgi:hypothetical protein
VIGLPELERGHINCDANADAGMSALPGEADIEAVFRRVGYGPIPLKKSAHDQGSLKLQRGPGQVLGRFWVRY